MGWRVWEAAATAVWPGLYLRPTPTSCHCWERSGLGFGPKLEKYLPISGLPDKAIHRVLWWDRWPGPSAIKSSRPDSQFHCVHAPGTDGWFGPQRRSGCHWSYQQDWFHWPSTPPTRKVWPGVLSSLYLQFQVGLSVFVCLFSVLQMGLCSIVCSCAKHAVWQAECRICFSQARKQILQIHTKEWKPKLSDAFLAELAERCVGRWPDL